MSVLWGVDIGVRGSYILGMQREFQHVVMGQNILSEKTFIESTIVHFGVALLWQTLCAIAPHTVARQYVL